MKKSVLIFLLLFAVSISCKKYEEGPLISFHSAKHRIIGDWKIVSYTVNGIDSMQFIKDNYLGGKWNFAPNYRDNSPKLLVYSDPDYVYGEWYLSNNKKTIFLSLTDFQVNGLNYWAYDSIPDWKFDSNWDIIRLKEDDMKFRLIQGSVVYEIHFKPN